MPRSYLDNGLSAFDSAFAAGTALGSSVVKERLARQQKLEDDARAQRREQENAAYNEQLQVQAYAQDRAAESQQKAQDRLRDLNDPVLNRSNMLNEDSQAVLAQLDAQDKRNGLALDPNDTGFSQEARQFAQTAIQANAARRQKIAQLMAQPISADNPVQLPSANPDASVDIDNEVSTLGPERMYTPTYLETLQSKGEQEMTPLQRAQISYYNAGTAQREARTKAMGGSGDQDLKLARKAIATGMGAVNAYTPYAGKQEVTDPLAEGYDADFAKNKTRYRGSAASGLAGLSLYAGNPAVLKSLTNSDDNHAQAAAKYWNAAMSQYGGYPTPEQFIDMRNGIQKDAERGDAGAQTLSKALAIPYVEEQQPSAEGADNTEDDSQ